MTDKWSRVLLILVVLAAFGGAARVDKDAVAESKLPSGRKDVRALCAAAYEEGQAERVGRHEAVVAHVPIGGVAQVGRMVEDADADDVVSDMA